MARKNQGAPMPGQEKPSMSERFEAFKKRTGMGSHRQIERQTITTAVLTGAVLLALTGSLASASARTAEQIDTTPAVLTEFKSSVTGAQGDVAGVYRSEDGKHALVLLKFDDPSAVSTQADNYEVMVTGTDMNARKQRIKGSIDGSLHMFGSSGYMAVRLTNPDTFASQILSLTFRAKTELTTRAEDPSSRARAEKRARLDPSGVDNDQWHVFVNPGAKGVEVSQALSQPQTSLRDLYYEMVVAEQESEVHATMNQQLAQLRADLNAVQEYTNRLATTTVNGMSLVIPPAPPEIEGDSMACADEGVDVAKCPEDRLVLVTDQVHPNGFEFDWRKDNVNQGYLEDVVQGEDYLEFLSRHGGTARGMVDLDELRAQGSAADSQDSTGEINYNNLDWETTDGKDIESYDATLAPVKSAKDAISLLTTGWQDYAKHKRDYQVGSMRDLLGLEVQLLDVESNATTNDAPEAVGTY